MLSTTPSPSVISLKCLAVLPQKICLLLPGVFSGFKDLIKLQTICFSFIFLKKIENWEPHGWEKKKVAFLFSQQHQLHYVTLVLISTSTSNIWTYDHSVTRRELTSLPRKPNQFHVQRFNLIENLSLVSFSRCKQKKVERFYNFLSNWFSLFAQQEHFWKR